MSDAIIIIDEKKLREVIKDVFLESICKEPQNPKDTFEYMDVDDLIIYLATLGIKLTKSKIYYFTKTFKIPFKKIGRKLLFSRTDILNWVKSQ